MIESVVYTLTDVRLNLLVDCTVHFKKETQPKTLILENLDVLDILVVNVASRNFRSIDIQNIGDLRFGLLSWMSVFQRIL